MAEVFLAKSFGVEGFQKTVAIKKILPHISEDESFVTMFIDEAKIVSGLQHANICQMYDFGRIGDDFYQVMEYISGLSIKYLERTMWESKRPLPVGAALHMVAKVCDGMDYAHSMRDRNGDPLNIVHRDVTPANILVSFEGAVKLIDFGIAKATQRATKTQAGIVKGKFGYMTPEQLQGKEIDNRSDIFSLGVVMWELLAGRLLFNEANDMDNLRRIIQGDWPSIGDVRSDLPPDLVKIVMKALAFDRDERYSTAEELGSDLNHIAYRMGDLWSTSKLQKFILENFKEDAQETWDKRKKYSNISSEDFKSYPSVGMSEEDEDEVEVLEMDDLLIEDVEIIEEDNGNKTDIYSLSDMEKDRIPQKESSRQSRDSKSTRDMKSAPSNNVQVSGSLDREAMIDFQKKGSQSREIKIMFDESQGELLSESPDILKDYNAYDPRYNSVYDNDYGDSNYLDQNSFLADGNSQIDGYNAGNNYGYGQDQYYPHSGEWYSYDQQAQGYYGEDGQWYPYENSNPGGYYGEDGQWYTYDVSKQNAQQTLSEGYSNNQSGVYQSQGTYGRNQSGSYSGQGNGYQNSPSGNYGSNSYPGTGSYQGYYGEDGQWYSYDAQHQGYYGEDGKWYSYDQQTQGYYGEDGQWYPGVSKQDYSNYYNNGENTSTGDNNYYAQGYYDEFGNYHPYPTGNDPGSGKK
ncbi:MAG: protein kinase [Deltaproteobacteria bacterium]|nr:protein kinase [Deltaproteobacteria bacterium]